MSKSFKRKVEAQQYLSKQVSAIEVGTWVDPSQSATLFETVAEQFMTVKSTKVKPTTLAGYRSLLDTVILPRWSSVALADVRYIDIQTWVAGLSAHGGGQRFADRGLSASRITQSHQLLGAVLQFAVRAEMLKSNPATGVDLPRKSEGRQIYLNHDQVDALAGASVGDYGALVLVLAYCGLRIGEATALRTSDVDLSTQSIRVDRSVTYVTGTGLVEGTTKNHRSRTVPIALTALGALRAVLENRGSDELIWPGSDGGWITNGAVRWAFDAAVKVCQKDDPSFPAMTPHALRHTTASLAISAGANPLVLQKMLGHETATMTLDRYGHLMPSDLNVVVAKMDAAAQASRAARARGLQAVAEVSA